MFSAVLIMHIAGAIATGIIAVYACTMMVLGRDTAYRMTAQLLAALAAFEVFTGIGLAVLSPEISVISVCGNIALYLAIVAALEVLLFLRMPNGVVRFPIVQTVSPISVGIAALIAGVVLGF